MSNDESKLKRTTYLPNYSLNIYFLSYLLKIEDAYSFNILLFARWFIHSFQHLFFFNLDFFLLISPNVTALHLL